MAISVSDILAYVRAEGIDTDEISDADMTAIINHIVGLYCRARPIHVVDPAGITTVADQPNYNVPSGTIYIEKVLWLARGAYSGTQLLAELIGASDARFGITLSPNMGVTELDFESPEQLARWRALLGSWSMQWAGTWQVLQTGSEGADQIWLDPPPSVAGTEVPVFFWRERTTATINATDLSMLQEAALAKARIRKFSDVDASVRVTMGAYAEELGATATVRAEMLKNARAAWEKFEALLQAPFIGVRS